jgi:hypothetical protein
MTAIIHHDERDEENASRRHLRPLVSHLDQLMKRMANIKRSPRVGGEAR